LWQVEAQQIAGARSYLERMSAQWDNRLERLRVFVEAD
jgi:hypothetical protein